MSGGCLRSALVLSWGGVDAPAVDRAAATTRELARLLGDPSVGGFEVSELAGADAPALQLELIRFLADRTPDDSVVVHLAGHLALNDDAEAYVGGPAPSGTWRADEGMPVAVLCAELDRCRSERMVIVVDNPAPRTASRPGPAPGQHVELTLRERLSGPGRSVHVVSTATFIDALLGTAASGHPEAADALRRALPPLGTERPSDAPATTPPVAPLAAAAAIMVVVSAMFIATLGLPGAVLSAALAAIVAGPLLRPWVHAWRQIPEPDVVLGEGVPFYELYMLRRSKKSKDHFRSHGMR